MENHFLCANDAIAIIPYLSANIFHKSKFPSDDEPPPTYPFYEESLPVPFPHHLHFLTRPSTNTNGCAPACNGVRCCDVLVKPLLGERSVEVALDQRTPALFGKCILVHIMHTTTTTPPSFCIGAFQQPNRVGVCVSAPEVCTGVSIGSTIHR